MTDRVKTKVSLPDLGVVAYSDGVSLRATVTFTEEELNLLTEITGGFVHEGQSTGQDPEELEGYEKVHWKLSEAYRLLNTWDEDEYRDAAVRIHRDEAEDQYGHDVLCRSDWGMILDRVEYWSNGYSLWLYDPNSGQTIMWDGEEWGIDDSFDPNE